MCVTMNNILICKKIKRLTGQIHFNMRKLEKHKTLTFFHFFIPT